MVTGYNLFRLVKFFDHFALLSDHFGLPDCPMGLRPLAAEHYPPPRYNLKSCPDGTPFNTTIAKCNGGVWQIMTINADKACKGTCPLKAPEPGAECKPDGKTCEYNGWWIVV